MSNAGNDSQAREHRVKQVLTEYYQAVDAGQLPDREELLRRHPDLAVDLQEFFADLERLEQLARPIRPGKHLDLSPTEPVTLGAGEAPCAEPIAGTKIRYFGDYELVEEIARGGMGVVFKARQQSLQRVVALKMILAGQLASPAEVRRFQTEAENAAQLDHPHIVPVYEVGEHDGQHYFSMKLIEGDSLAQHMERLRKDPKAAARLLATVARAVHHAHQRGILHRDLKPANILLDGRGEPHVTDFGLARRVETDRGQTQSGAIVGTPSYMAPEQATARKTLTTATDVDSLGAVFYEILTGRPPFRGDNPIETLLQVVEREPERPRALNREVDRDLETICLKCLNKVPENRYESAGALAEDLERWLKHEPIKARRSGPLRRTLKWARRYPAAAALVAVCVVGIGILAWFNFRLRSAVLENRRRLYAAQINLAQQADEKGEVEIALRLLDQHLPQSGEDLRSFEWYYLWRRLHLDRFTLSHKENHSGRRSRLYSLKVSPNGHMVLTRAEKNFTLWDVTTGQEIATLEADVLFQGEESIFSPDSKLVALASKNGTVTIWDTGAARVKTVLRGHSGPVASMAFAPDGKTLATGGKDITARLWEVRTGRERARLTGHTRGVMSVAYSPDGKTLATGSGWWGQTVGEAKLWHPATGRKRRTFRPVGTPVQTWVDGKWTDLPGELCYVMFTPDGKTLATVVPGRDVKLWDLATGLKRATLDYPARDFRDVAFDPKSQFVAVRGVVWDLAAGKRVFFPGKPGGRPGGAKLNRALADYHASVFSPDGKTFARVGVFQEEEGGEAELWDTARWEKRTTFKQVDVGRRHGYRVTSLAFGPDSKTVAIACVDSIVRLYDVATGRLRALLKGHTKPVLSVTFTSDGKSIVTLSRDDTIKVWNADADDGSITFKGHLGPVYAVAYAPDSLTLATGGEDGTVRLWEVASGKRLATLRGHSEPVLSLAFTPDGKTLATGSGFLERRLTRERRLGKKLPAKGEIILWDLPRKRKRTVLKQLEGSISCLAFHPEGEILGAGVNYENAEGVPYGTLNFWDLGTGEERFSFHCTHELCPVRSLVFRPDGKAFAMADLAVSGVKEVMFWDAATGEQRTYFRFPEGEMVGEADSIAISPKGETLALEWADKRVRLWDTRTGKARVSIQQLPFRFEERKTFEPGNLLAFSSDGKTLATVSGDKLVKLWQAATGTELITLQGHAGKIYCVRFSPDGKTLATASKDGTTKVWRAAGQEEVAARNK
jgi:WD40 repeat protein/serine/threonine protein kinase